MHDDTFTFISIKIICVEDGTQYKYHIQCIACLHIPPSWTTSRQRQRQRHSAHDDDNDGNETNSMKKKHTHENKRISFSLMQFKRVVSTLLLNSNLHTNRLWAKEREARTIGARLEYHIFSKFRTQQEIMRAVLR